MNVFVLRLKDEKVKKENVTLDNERKNVNLNVPYKAEAGSAGEHPAKEYYGQSVKLRMGENSLPSFLT